MVYGKGLCIMALCYPFLTIAYKTSDPINMFSKANAYCVRLVCAFRIPSHSHSHSPTGSVPDAWKASGQRWLTRVMAERITPRALLRAPLDPNSTPAVYFSPPGSLRPPPPRHFCHAATFDAGQRMPTKPRPHLRRPGPRRPFPAPQLACPCPGIIPPPLVCKRARM